MKKIILDILRCPKTGNKLNFVDCEFDKDGKVKTGFLESQGTDYKYQITNYIPRFVPVSNYADNFGMQWNKFSHTQLDSYSGYPISSNRFYQATNWTADELKDKWVLDVGCGAGRFAEIALKAGANVVALDYSSAVDACYNNLKNYENLTIIQGDIYELPFETNFFEFVYSLGVLQHTPNVSEAFFALPEKLKIGGKICIDFYEKSWKSLFLPKYWLRPITRNIPKMKLFYFLEKVIPYLFELSEILRKIPFFGKYLKRFIPVANWSDELPLSKHQLKEWALLDTFDWLSPAYDNPQSNTTIKKWLQESNFLNIEVLKAGHLVGRGTKQS